MSQTTFVAFISSQLGNGNTFVPQTSPAKIHQASWWWMADESSRPLALRSSRPVDQASMGLSLISVASCQVSLDGFS